MTDPKGRTALKERYEILSTLGEGAFATTYLAHDRLQDRKCVVKTLSLRQVDALKTQELFEREAHVLRSLDHPQIPKLIDFFTLESERDIQVHVVQDYVEGKNLAEWVASGKRFTESEVVAIALDITRILEYLQSFNPPLIHRDIKPSNVIRTGEGKVYLVDFGAVRDKVLHEPLLQRGGPTIVGTYGYMPLEQFEGQAGAASDVYSLGATLIYLLSHKEPWQMDKDGMRLDFHPHLHVSAGFARVLERMIEPDWNKRYPSAGDLRGELERLRQTKRPGKARAVAPAALLLLTLLAGVGLLTLLRGEPARDWPPAMNAWLPDTEPEDALGDPLPRGAIRRLGTVRLRHGGPVRAVAFSPDGKVVASGSDDQTLSLWEVSTGREIFRFHTWREVGALAFSPDGRRLAGAGAQDGPVYVWELPSGKRLFRLQGPPRQGSNLAGEHALAFSPDGTILASTGKKPSLQLWSVATGEPLHSLTLPEGATWIGFSPSGRTLVAGGRDGGVEFWDVTAGTLTSSHKFLERLWAFALSPDGRRLAATYRGDLRWWDVATGRELVKLAATDIRALAFSPTGRRLAGARGSGSILVWNVETGKRLSDLDGHPGVVRSLAFSPDGETLASGGEDGTVRLWGVETGKERHSLPGHEGEVSSLAFARDGSVLVSGGSDRSARRWSRGGQEIHKRLLNRPLRLVSFLPEGRLLAAEEDRFHVWDGATNWEILEAPLSGASHFVPLTGDGTRLATREGEDIAIRDVATGRRLLQLREDEYPLAFSPNGEVLATIKGNRRMVLRQASSGEKIFEADQPNGWGFSSVCFSPDGKFLVTDSSLWRVEPASTRQRLSYLSVYQRPGALCAVSPDGRLVAAGGDPTSTIYLYETRRTPQGGLELKRRSRLGGHRGPVRSLAFSPDSRTLASGSADTSILLWDVEASLPESAGGPRGAAGGPPRLRLSFDGHLGGEGVAPGRFTEDDGTFRFVPGKFGQAAHLDGQLEFPETREIVLGDSFTVQFWFQLDEGATWREGRDQQIVASELVSFDVRSQGTSPIAFIHFIHQGGHASVQLGEHMGRVAPGRWYHLAIVHDGAAKTLQVYLNGTPLSSQPAQYGIAVSDRMGALRLGQWWENRARFQGKIDELNIYDYARTPEQIATDGLSGETRDQPPPQPLPVPVELPILSERVSEFIEKATHPDFTVYRLVGDLSNTQLLDLDAADGIVWIGTGKGLIRFEPAAGAWNFYGTTAGLPGERVSRVAALGGRVVVDLGRYTGPHSVYGTGTHLFDPRPGTWTQLFDGFVWDLHWDGKNLWVGLGHGAESREIVADFAESGAAERFTPQNSGLLHGDVHAVRTWGQTVWFAMLGDHVKEKDEFFGGGVSVLDRSTGEWRSYTTKDGLARDYSCALAVDDRQVWVGHGYWDPVKGLSLLDRKAGAWSVLKKSANGIDLGGFVLANDGNTLWIGQRGLVKLDKETRQATLYTEREGLPGYIVSGIAVDQDSVWVSAYSYGQPEVRSAGVVQIPRQKN